jgi:hypothetical protein
MPYGTIIADKTWAVFSVLGAASPQTAVLPLFLISIVTAVKDGVKDYRRAQLDEEVSASAVI